MINEICEKVLKQKIVFKNAFNHSSFANKNNLPSNERLEFFGDSIINFYVSSFLFKTNKSDEGTLSKQRAKMVSTSCFAKICDKINLCKDLKIIGTINAKIKANLFEAVIAEIYLQLKNKNDIDKLIHYLIIDDFKSSDFEDSKTLLQEILQKKHHLIVYKTTKIGSKFVAKVFNCGLLLAQGEGQGKQQAEKMAAKIALSKLKKEGK